MIPIRGCVKNYHWGKRGKDNYVAHFVANAPKCLSVELSGGKSPNIDDKTPMAEIWFGSHPSGPSTLIIGDHMIKMNEFLSKEPEMVGVVELYLKYKRQLPFLFKVLSVAQPLSLQAHPDKKLAEILHRQDPKNYPDSNHKPELAIALTDFHVLCDFRPHEEILNYLKHLKPLQQIVGENNFTHYLEMEKKSEPTPELVRSALANCFKSLMSCQREIIMREAKNLKEVGAQIIGKDLHNLICELDQLYPGDPGLFAPLFLNYIKLAPGEGVFLEANKLHAYLKGECIECMACSDNVVRAGLTTKYRDVKTLIDMLDYQPVRSFRDLILTPKEVSTSLDKSGCSKLAYLAPSDEFKVEKLTITNRSDMVMEPKLSGSFIIVLSGTATTKDFFDAGQEHKLHFGYSGFIPPKIGLRLSNIQGPLVMYRAYC